MPSPRGDYPPARGWETTSRRQMLVGKSVRPGQFIAEQSVGRAGGKQPTQGWVGEKGAQIDATQKRDTALQARKSMGGRRTPQ